MHVLGKVLIFLLAAGAIAAILLTTMALDVRTHWLQQVAQAREEYAKIERDLISERYKHRNAQEALDRVKLGWGNVWMAPNSRPVNPATGTVSIGQGLQQGLGQPAAARAPNPTVYIFNVNGDQSEYLGEFRIQSAQPGSADAVLSRRPWPGENFPAGTWRVRESVPFNYAARFLDQYRMQIAAEARLERMRYDVTRRQEQLAATQNLLQQRIYQLEGDPTLTDASELQRVGYVQALRDGLAQRDALLAKLHALRVERRLKYESLVLIQQENEERLRRYTVQLGVQPEYSPPAAPGAPASP